MRIEYEATFDDYQYLCDRIADDAKVKMPSYWRFVPTTVIVTGGMWYYLFRRYSLPIEIGLVTFLLVCGLVVLPWLDRRGRMAKLRELLTEYRGHARPTAFAVEIRDDRLWVQESSHDTRFDWTSLRSINESSDYIEIGVEARGRIVVAKRGFPSEAVIGEFKDRIKRRIAENPPA